MHQQPSLQSDEFHRRSHKAYAARKNAHLVAADCTSMLVETLALEKVRLLRGWSMQRWLIAATR